LGVNGNAATTKAEAENTEESQTLLDLVIKYFKKNGYKTEQNVLLEGSSGISRKFDLIVRKGNKQQLVLVKDWKRTVGVNMVINMDKASDEVGLANSILISEKFSSHAKAYAHRRGITLLTKREILTRMG